MSPRPSPFYQSTSRPDSPYEEFGVPRTSHRDERELVTVPFRVQLLLAWQSVSMGRSKGLPDFFVFGLHLKRPTPDAEHSYKSL